MSYSCFCGAAISPETPETSDFRDPNQKYPPLQPAVPHEAEVLTSVRGVGCRAAWPFMVALPSLGLHSPYPV